MREESFYLRIEAEATFLIWELSKHESMWKVFSVESGRRSVADIEIY